MAVANRNRGGQQQGQQGGNQPPQAPPPAPAPVAPAPPPAPAPRPVTPRVAIEAAAVQLVGQGVDLIDLAVARDNARRQELEEAETRARRSARNAGRFWLVMALIAIAAIVIMGLVLMDGDGQNSDVGGDNNGGFVTTPVATPPTTPAIAPPARPTTAIGTILVLCGGDETPCPTTTEDCLGGTGTITASAARACCGSIPDATERDVCLKSVQVQLVKWRPS